MATSFFVLAINNQGQPITGGTVVVTSDGQSADTDDTGTAQLNMPTSTVVGIGIDGSDSGYSTAAMQTFSPTAGQTIPIVVPTLNPGTVGLSFASVNTADINWTITTNAGTVQSGTASVGQSSANPVVRLSAGPYTITAVQGGATETQTFTVASDGSSSVTVQFTASTDPNSVDEVAPPSGANPALSTPPSSSLTNPQPDSYEFLYPNLSYDRYYTASQVRMYVGSTFVDEANSVQFILQANKTPVYGYASDRPDAYGGGRTIIQGQLIINFVSHGYLYAILNNFANQQSDQATNQQATSIVMATQALGGATPAPTTTTDLLRSSFFPSQMFDAVPASSKQIVSQYVSSQYSSISAASVPSASANLQSILMNSTPAAVDAAKSTVQRANRAALQGVDVNPAYGKKTFDLLMEIGAGQSQNDDGSSSSYRFRRWLRNCIIVSNECITAPDGRVLQESYGFLARSVDVAPPAS